MPTLKTSGLRIAAAGTAAAALTLAAAAPAFAQDGVDFWFNMVDTNDEVEVLEYEAQEAYIAVEGPDPLDGDVVEVIVDFDGSGVIEVTTTDDRCEFYNQVLTCVDDGTHALAGTFFDLELGLGDNGEPGETAHYFWEVRVNGEWAVDDEGQIQVAEDFDTGESEDDPALPEDFPVSDLEEADDAYGFAFLNHILEGAGGGATVTAVPQFRIEEESGLGDDRAATALFFSHSVSLDAWFDEDDPTGHHTENIRAIADYDNCAQWPGGVMCVVEDFEPQVGATYTPSVETPVQYTVDNETSDVDLGAYYTAWDINEATLDLFRNDVYLGSEDQLRLVEAEQQIEDKYFKQYYGLILFTESADGHEDIEAADPEGAEPTEDDANGQLPKTGSSSIIMISAAGAAIAAGAVVFFMLRRRKVAQSWE